ncbi:MAG: hypothetical protein H7843_03630 [Nitrospirota bacterium]
MSQSNKTLRQALLYAILISAVTAFVELSSYVTYRVIYKSWMSFEQLENDRHGIIKSMRTDAGNMNIPAVKLFHLLHPYYGYVLDEIPDERLKNIIGLDKIKIDRNRYGFFGKNDPVQQRSEQNLLVGVTGGSVATVMTVLAEDTLVKHLSEIPEFKGRKVILINIASLAYKQPQQLHVVSDIIAQGGNFDILINLDGFNEIVLPLAHHNIQDGIPFHFPRGWRTLTERKISKDQEIAMAMIALAEKRRTDASLIFSSWLPSHTATGNLMWKVLDAGAKQKKEASEAALTKLIVSGDVGELHKIRSTQCGTAFLGTDQQYKTVRDLYIDIVRHWQRSSVMLNNLIANQGGMYFQFLQPNQYFIGSKPLSAEEVSVALATSSPFKQEVERGFPYMRAGGVGLHKAGVNFTDLTLMFKAVKTQVYIDSCCHLNKEGYDLIVNAIADTVAKTVSASGFKPAPNAVKQGDDHDFDNLRRYTLDVDRYDDGANTPIPPRDAIQ